MQRRSRCSQPAASAQPGDFGEWNGQLLRCATHANEPHARLDPATARLVEAARDEALACLNGTVSRGRAGRPLPSARNRETPLFSLDPRFAAYEPSIPWPYRTYRFVSAASDGLRIDTTPRPYHHFFGIPNQDAAMMSYVRGTEWLYVRFDIEQRTETTVFATNGPSNPGAGSATRSS